MIHYALFCILWSKPEIKLIEVPVSEYAMATMSEDFRDFNFYADVVEEKMNSIKIIHLASGASADASAPNDHQQRSLSMHLRMPDTEASLDCEIRQQQ